MKARARPASIPDDCLLEPIATIWPDWMRPLDRVLDEEQRVESVYEALQRRHPRSRTRGRRGTPAEVV